MFVLFRYITTPYFFIYNVVHSLPLVSTTPSKRPVTEKKFYVKIFPTLHREVVFRKVWYFRIFFYFLVIKRLSVSRKPSTLSVNLCCVG